MRAGRGFIEEKTGGFDHDLGSDLIPFQRGRILHRGQADFFAIHDQGAAFDGNLPLEAAMHRVVFQHVSQIRGLQQIVDADDLDVLRKVLHSGAEDHAADTAESIDANFNHSSWELGDAPRSPAAGALRIPAWGGGVNHRLNHEAASAPSGSISTSSCAGRAPYGEMKRPGGLPSARPRHQPQHYSVLRNVETTTNHSQEQRGNRSPTL